MASCEGSGAFGETPADRHAWVRAHADMFFSTAGPTEAALMNGLVSDAVILGCMNVNAIRTQGWCVVGAESDWLALGAIRPVLEVDPETDLFTNLCALPEAGRECHRHEVFVASFAKVVITSSQSGVRLIQGTVGEEDPIFSFLRTRQEWARCIAFHGAVA